MTGTHQASDKFIMPLSLNMIPEFQRFSNVQLNVFKNPKRDLIPMVVSKIESLNIFTMDLFLIYKTQTHLFVLIKELLRFLCGVRKQKFPAEVSCSCSVYAINFITTKLITKRTRDSVKILNWL